MNICRAQTQYRSIASRGCSSSSSPLRGSPALAWWSPSWPWRRLHGARVRPSRQVQARQVQAWQVWEALETWNVWKAQGGFLQEMEVIHSSSCLDFLLLLLLLHLLSGLYGFLLFHYLYELSFCSLHCWPFVCINDLFAWSLNDS